MEGLFEKEKKALRSEIAKLVRKYARTKSVPVKHVWQRLTNETGTPQPKASYQQLLLRRDLVKNWIYIATGPFSRGSQDW